MGNMFKTDIIAEVAKITGLPKSEVEKTLNGFTETVITGLKNGNDISLIGFGSFKVVPTKAKIGRNPRTGKEIKIPAGKKVKFTIGKTLKDSVK